MLHAILFCNFALSSPQPFLRTYKELFIIASALFLSSVSAQSTDPLAIGASRAQNSFCLLLWGSHSKPTWILLIVLLCMKFLFTPSPHIYPVLCHILLFLLSLFLYLSPLLLSLSLFLFVSATGYVFHYYLHLQTRCQATTHEANNQTMACKLQHISGVFYDGCRDVVRNCVRQLS